MNEPNSDPDNLNVFASPQAEDDTRELAANNPLKAQRGMALGLLLWVTWLLVVLGAIVWFVG